MSAKRNAIVFSSSLNTLFKYCHGGGWLNVLRALQLRVGKWQKAEAKEQEEERVEKIYFRLHKKGTKKKAKAKQFKLPLINKTWSS